MSEAEITPVETVPQPPPNTYKKPLVPFTHKIAEFLLHKQIQKEIKRVDVEVISPSRRASEKLQVLEEPIDDYELVKKIK